MAQVPVSVAIGDTGLSPLQPWQLAQALTNTCLPRAFAVMPSLCEARGVSLLYRRNKGNGTWVVKASDGHVARGTLENGSGISE
ncbi:hypothetical protein QCM80_16005 [Bradyrhizobium sp. SSUT112]|nr:hypothetical protein [Bradyrhizobium sp. SSUT112]MDH2352158.1 hypothetical protein [Bradyrhizobium sp. SSUT112]